MVSKVAHQTALLVNSKDRNLCFLLLRRKTDIPIVADKITMLAAEAVNHIEYDELVFYGFLSQASVKLLNDKVLHIGFGDVCMRTEMRKEVIGNRQHIG